MHMLVAVTGHGFGHAAQVAPVINTLRQHLPSLRVTVRSGVPEAFLKQRIHGEFELVDRSADFGLIMNSALDIDLQRSAGAYAEVHNRWEAKVSEEARWLQRLAPDLVLADASYLVLAAAREAAIPAVALCSLNWADIYRSYFVKGDRERRILRQMEAGYNAARVFLCPEPSMPMTWLDNKMAIGPIAVRGRNRRKELNDTLGIEAETALVLVAPGGVRDRFAMERWPSGKHIRWLVSEDWRVSRPDVTALERAGMPFTDLLASCDAVLGKCGYGTVTECVVNGTPLCYVARPGWFEESSLLAWLREHRAAVEVPAARLVRGDLQDIVEAARALRVIRCEPKGAEQAAALLQRYLKETRSRVGRADPLGRA